MSNYSAFGNEFEQEAIRFYSGLILFKFMFSFTREMKKVPVDSKQAF